MKLLKVVEAPVPEVLLQELEIRAGNRPDGGAELAGWELYQKKNKDGAIKYPAELMHLILPPQELVPISRVHRAKDLPTERQRRRCFRQLLKRVPILSPYPTSVAMLLDERCQYHVSISKCAGKGELPAVTELDREGLVDEGMADGGKKGRKGKKVWE